MRILIISCGVCLCLAALLYWFVQQPFLFISWESKTINGEAVYNRIKFIPGWQVDTWIMQQSHEGLLPPTKEWDRLAIVVDKSTKPPQASFYQFRPGELSMGTQAEVSAYRAPCLACHVSGPRAIRPQSYNWLQGFKTTLLNLRIKSYFQIDSIRGQAQLDNAPFQRRHASLKAPLPLKSCALCHGDGKIRRGLTLDHLTTAEFLIKNGQMPPWPFSLAHEDREQLKKWGL